MNQTPDKAITDADPVVFQNRTAQRFELNIQGQTAVLTYRQSPGVITFVHTEVPPPLRGKGLARKIVSAAFEFARSENLKVVPLCAYVIAYLRRHPEYQDLVSKDSPEP